MEVGAYNEKAFEGKEPGKVPCARSSVPATPDPDPDVNEPAHTMFWLESIVQRPPPKLPALFHWMSFVEPPGDPPPPPPPADAPQPGFLQP